MQTIDCAKRITALVVLSCLALLSGCGGGSGSGSGSGDPDPPVANVAGDWRITETLGGNDCGESGTRAYLITVTTNGNSVTVRTDVGTFTGTIDGDRLEWSGSYPEDGGSTTITDMDLTVSRDGNAFSGTTSWRWSDGSFNCSGTTSVSGERTSGPPGGGGGGGGGATESEPNNTFADADTIGTGTVTGAVNSSSDGFDWFLFSAPTGGVYNVSLSWSSAASDLDLGVTTASSECVSDDVGTVVENCNGSALNGGESMFILVQGFATGGVPQTYTLNVE